jgi:hypothetical protein
MVVSGAHTVGAPDGGRGLPGTGWSTTHGDLRVAHFVGLHAMQVLPLLTLGIRRIRRGQDTQARSTVVLAVSYAALFGVMLAQAVRGNSVAAPDSATWLALGVWAMGSAAAWWWSGRPTAPASRDQSKGYLNDR